MAEGILRLAVIGAGPKALSALDSLGRRLRAAGRGDGPREVRIDIVDPSERPGTGAAYDPAAHPGHGDGTTLGAERPHLDEWRARGW